MAWNPTANFLARLPAINGHFEAGIAIGSDQSLADSDRLVVYPEIKIEGKSDLECHHVRAVASALWALRQNQGLNSEIAIVGAYCAVYFGLIGTLTSGAPEGEYVMAENLLAPPSDDETVKLKELLIEKRINQTLTMMIATKANYYMTNHHTGESMVSASGYTKKVINMYVTAQNSDTVKMVHKIGHWCSTLLILRKAEVPGIRTDNSSLFQHRKEYTLAQDALLRFQAPPAGVHKMAVLEIAVRKLIAHDMCKYWIMLTELAAVLRAMAQLRAMGARCHIGAKYLTNGDRADTQEAVANAVHGRLGAFIRTFFSGSTLVQSPHFTEKAMKSAEDFDPTWLNHCAQFKTLASRAFEQIQISVPEEHTPESIAAFLADINGENPGN